MQHLNAQLTIFISFPSRTSFRRLAAAFCFAHIVQLINIVTASTGSTLLHEQTGHTVTSFTAFSGDR
jgi:hypothetical protein